MPRGKVNLSYIQNESARRKCLDTRKVGLLKKAHELSTLCGVDVCAIVYSPNNSEPVVWPSRLGAEYVVRRFKAMTAYAKSENMENPDKFSKQKLSKVDGELKKLQKENRFKELAIAMNNHFNDREWMKNQSYDDLIYLKNHVVEPHLAELVKRRGGENN